MPFYVRVGDVPRRRRDAHREPGGGVLTEEILGTEGTSAESAVLYHRHSPAAILSADALGENRQPFEPNQPLLPRHFRTTELDRGGDVVTSRHVLVGNDDVTVAFALANEPSPMYRNAVGDELVYVQRGRAVLESVFGRLEVEPGTYVVVPSGVTHRWRPDGGELLACLIVEARGTIRPPLRYLSPAGQFLQSAPYTERDLRTPEGPLLVDGQEVAVLVRHAGGRSRYVFQHHPFDVVAWDGCLYPWALSIHDVEPFVGRPGHPPRETFEGAGFTVGSVVPLPPDFPPPPPASFHHADVDKDELTFVAAGTPVGAARGVGAGSLLLHPAGFPTGPRFGGESTTVDDLVLVVVRTARPMGLSNVARLVDDKHYATHWAKTAGA